MRILFVDDEPQVLDGLRVVFRKQRRAWEMTFASGGEVALEQMRDHEFDVVVSDMRMPGMDGATFLAHVKELHPSAIRIILSGHAEREAVLRALPVSHQFLAKPCNPDKLRAIIEGMRVLRERVSDDDLKVLVTATEHLPALPKVCIELNEAMRDPEVSTRSIAGIVEHDPAVSAKLLKIANSGYFGLAHPIATVASAVTYLGMDLVRSLACAAHLFSAWEKDQASRRFSVEELQRHSLLVGRVAAQLVPADQAGETFTAALLHDVGRMLLARADPDAMQRILAEACPDRTAGKPPSRRARAERAKRLIELEREAYGVTHTEVGAYLVSVWGLPSAIVDAVAYHHEPSRIPPIGPGGTPRFGAAGAVHFANAIVDTGTEPDPDDDDTAGLDLAYLEACGVRTAIPKLTNLANEEVRRWRVRNLG